MCYLCGATEQDVCTHTCMASTGFICLTRNEEDMSKWKFMDDAVVLIWYRVQPRLPWLSWCGFVRDVSLFWKKVPDVSFLCSMQMWLLFASCWRIACAKHNSREAECSTDIENSQSKMFSKSLIHSKCKMLWNGESPNTQWYKWWLVLNGRISSAWRELFVSTVNCVCMHAFVTSE